MKSSLWCLDVLMRSKAQRVKTRLLGLISSLPRYAPPWRLMFFPNTIYLTPEPKTRNMRPLDIRRAACYTA